MVNKIVFLGKIKIRQSSNYVTIPRHIIDFYNLKLDDYILVKIEKQLKEKKQTDPKG